MCDKLPISFRYVKGFEKYDVDNHGRVYSNDYNHTMTRKEMRQYLDQDGYPYIFFQIDGKRYKKMVHRLVLENFKGLPSKKLVANHINGIRNDNHLKNLEWVTSQVNTIDGFKRGRKISDEQKHAMQKGTILYNHNRWHQGKECLCEI